MAQTTTQAKLGLQISAKDEASKIFEEFAKNVKASMEEVNKYIKDALKMDSIAASVSDDSKKITDSMKGIEDSTKQLKDNKFGTNIADQLKLMQDAANTSSSRVDDDLKKISAQSKAVRHSVDQLTHSMHFGDMVDAGMALQQTGEKGVGFFVEAIKAGAEFDQSIKNATSSLNANRDKVKLSKSEIEAMSKSALQMGSDGFFSANQIAEAMNTMAKQGISYQTIMSGGIQVVKNVAAANQQDLEETANVVSDIFNEMQESFKHVSTQQAAQEIGTSMTVALHHARLSMSDFLATMKYVGPQASATGMSIKDISAAIAVLGEHGIKSSQAGTTLRRMLTNLTPASAAASSLMKKLGMITKDGGNIFYDSSGKMKSMVAIQKLLHDHISGLTPQMQQFAIKTIFGQYALSGMTAIINTNNGTFQKLTKEMKNNAEMDDIMATKKKGLMMQIQALNAHWQTMQKEIGLMLVPVLNVLLSVANKLMNAWDGLSKPMQKGIVIFAAVSAAVLLIGGTLMTAIGLFGMFAGSMAAAMAGFAAIGSAIATIMPVILAVVAIIVALKYAWDHNLGGIRQTVNSFIEWFKAVFFFTFQKVKSDVEDGIKAFKNAFHGMDVSGPVNKVIKFLTGDLVNGLMKVVSAVASGITTMSAWFKKMAPQFGEAIKRIVAFLVWLTPLWKALWTVLKFVVGLVFDWIVGIIKHFWGVFSGIIQLIVDLINGNWKAVFKDLWQIVKNAFLLVLDLWGGALGKFFGFFAKIIERTGIFGKAFNTIFGGAFKLAEKAADGMWKYVEKIWQAGVKIVGSLLSPFHGLVGKIFYGIADLVSKHSGDALKFFQKAFEAILHVGKILLTGLKDYFKFEFDIIKLLFYREPAAWMVKLKTEFTAGVNYVKTHLTQWGQFISTQFNKVKGYITDHVNAAITKMKDLFSKGVSYVKGVLTKWGNEVKSVYDKVKGYIEVPVGNALKFLKTMFSTEINAVKTILNVFKSLVNAVFTAIKDLITGHSDKAMSALKTAFKLGVTALKGILGGIGSLIDSVLGGLPSKMLNWGKNAMNMFVQGIKSGIGAIGSAVSSAANKIKDFLGFHSPAKEGPAARGESDQWMPNMMNMLAKGIDGNKDKIQKATMGVALGIQQTFSGTQKVIHQSMNGSNSTSPITTHNRSNSQQVVNINIEGRSVKTDQQLAENIAKQFHTQMSMVRS